MKQPYFVYRSTACKDGPHGSTPRPYLLLAGLWTSVSTGWPDQPKLDTFTILTTEVCPPLRWLHTRMPVVVWDERLAMAWLERPTPMLHRQLDEAAQTTAATWLHWHAVTPGMSSMKFRTAGAVQALPKLKTVKSFFAAAAAAGSASTKALDRVRTPLGKTAKTATNASNAERPSPKPAISSPVSNADTSAKATGNRAAPETGAFSQTRSPLAKQGKSPVKTLKASPIRPIDSFFQPKSTTKKK
jgi:hypothetical protein